MWTIAALTFREVLRKRILLVALLLTAGFLVLFGWALSEIGRGLAQTPDQAYASVFKPQFLSVGLYLSSLIVGFLAIFSAVGAISGEVENGTLNAIVPKPIRRSEILLGKYLGYGTMLVIYAGLVFLAIVTEARVFLQYEPVSVLAGLGLYVLQPLIILAITMLGTSFLPTMANGVTMAMLLAVGIIGGVIEQIGVMIRSVTLENIGIVSSLIIPADAIYRKAVSVLVSSGAGPMILAAGPFGSASPPSVWMVVYALIYLLGALALAVRVFERRDI